jgi:hypothetical protein
MKTPFFIPFFLLLITISLTCCKKSTETQASLIGKWKIDSIQLLFVTNGQGVFQTISKPNFDYNDYRIDNRLYRYYNGRYDTIPYEQEEINGNLFIKYAQRITDTVKLLTNESLIFVNPQGGASKYFCTRQK